MEIIMNKGLSTKKLVITALMAALTCVATMIITIPSPLKGYINLGDCVVLSAGWMLAPGYAFFAAGLGSGLADVFSGYVLYAPATFLIKGLMAIVAGVLFRVLGGSVKKRDDKTKSNNKNSGNKEDNNSNKKSKTKSKRLVARIISGAAAEIIMVAGYYVFEAVLYGAVASLANIPANGVQGVAGLILGCVLIKVLEKIKLS